MPATTSRLGRVSTWFGRLCVLAAMLGPTLAHFELVAPLTGFVIFGLGLLLALSSLLLGAMALIVGPAGTRGGTAAGLILPLALVAVAYFAAGSGRGVPRINDITTDSTTPPQFVYAGTLAENVGRDMAYPGASFATQQASGYPDLAPLALAMPPDEAFKQVAAAARSMPEWVITREDPAAHALEGYDTSGVFRFKDDFVIEVRAGANGQSVVQMRSKSRDGQGDMGINAKRIKGFFQRLQS